MRKILRKYLVRLNEIVEIIKNFASGITYYLLTVYILLRSKMKTDQHSAMCLANCERSCPSCGLGRAHAFRSTYSYAYSLSSLEESWTSSSLFIAKRLVSSYISFLLNIVHTLKCTSVVIIACVLVLFYLGSILKCLFNFLLT